jgi:hypothetical protein
MEVYIIKRRFGLDGSFYTKDLTSDNFSLDLVHIIKRNLFTLIFVILWFAVLILLLKINPEGQ